MHRRWWFRLAIGGALAMLLGVGVLATRPDLRLAVERLNIFPPSLDPEVRVKAAAARPDNTPIEWVDDGWCGTHHRPESTCAECAGKDHGPNRDCGARLRVVRLASPDLARRLGFTTAPVVDRTHADVLIGNAEIAYDANAYAEVRPRVAGFIREVLSDEGQKVERGQELIVVDSAEVGSAKAAYLAALPLVQLATSTLERTRDLARSNALPLKDELEAQTVLSRSKAELLNATQRLRNLGFQEVELAQLSKSQDTSSLLRVLAPIGGTVVSRHAVNGEAVEASSQLFVVADIARMWAWVDVYENEIERVKSGQQVTFRLAGFESTAYRGHVDWIDAAVNPTTRTIRVRTILENPDGRLRANQFGRAEIRIGEEYQAPFVPKEAIQTIGGDRVVFVAQADGSYRPQRIVVEAWEHYSNEEEVEWGVKPGDQVVTTGAFLLKSELLRHELGGE